MSRKYLQAAADYQPLLMTDAGQDEHSRGVDDWFVTLTPMITQARLRRLMRWLLVLTGLTLLTYLWLTNAWRGQAMLVEHSQQAARAQVEQAARSAARLLQADQDLLQPWLDDLVKDPFIADAALFDESGKLLASSAGAANYSELIAERQTLPGVSRLKTPLVAPLVQDDHGKGYLRVSYRMIAANQYAASFINELMSAFSLMLLLALMVSWLIARSVMRAELQRHWPK